MDMRAQIANYMPPRKMVNTLKNPENDGWLRETVAQVESARKELVSASRN
jgi:hypothetical protein